MAALVKRIHDLHPRYHLTDYREPERIETGVVAIADEKLRRARVRATRGVGDGAADVTSFHRVVGDATLAPRSRNGGIPVEAELRDEIVDRAEEPDTVVEARSHEIVQAVGPTRSPVAVDLDVERPARRDDVYDETVGRLRRSGGRLRARAAAARRGTRKKKKPRAREEVQRRRVGGASLRPMARDPRSDDRVELRELAREVRVAPRSRFSPWSGPCPLGAPSPYPLYSESTTGMPFGPPARRR